LRIGTLTTHGQMSSQLCTNFGCPLSRLLLPIHLCTFTRKNPRIFLNILI